MRISDTNNTPELYYETKIKNITKEARQILECTDDEFEFIWSKNKFPIYFNNKNKCIGIFNINGVWFCNEYIDNFVVKPNTKKKIYNKRTKSFEEFRDLESKKILDIYQDVSYCYDNNGDVVYFSPLNPNICAKYINGKWEKNEYETQYRKRRLNALSRRRIKLL